MKIRAGSVVGGALKKRRGGSLPLSLHRADCHDTDHDHAGHAQDDETAEDIHDVDLKISEEVTHCSFLSGLLGFPSLFLVL
jgi:hypothetical protein